MGCVSRALYLNGIGLSPSPQSPLHFPYWKQNFVINNKAFDKFHFPLLACSIGNGGSSGNNNNNNNNNNPFGSWWWHGGNGGDDDSSGSFYSLLLFVPSLLYCFCHWQVATAIARTATSSEDDGNKEYDAVWEVKGSKRTKLIPDFTKDAFVVASASNAWLSSLLSVNKLWDECRELFVQFMLPEGFPDSVTSDYLNYSLWRSVQGVASQISGVLATQVTPKKKKSNNSD